MQFLLQKFLKVQMASDRLAQRSKTVLCFSLQSKCDWFLYEIQHWIDMFFIVTLPKFYFNIISSTFPIIDEVDFFFISTILNSLLIIKYFQTLAQKMFYQTFDLWPRAQTC